MKGKIGAPKEIHEGEARVAMTPASAKELKKRTLTNLYNARPAWLDHAHRTLDEAVANAYGWGDLFKEKASPTALPEWIDGAEDEILARLFRLNQERAEAEA